ncbi:MAG: hypothetical protein AB7L92_03780 [Alphaproteobacteria bacterium]
MTTDKFKKRQPSEIAAELLALVAEPDTPVGKGDFEQELASYKDIPDGRLKFYSDPKYAGDDVVKATLRRDEYIQLLATLQKLRTGQTRLENADKKAIRQSGTLTELLAKAAEAHGGWAYDNSTKEDSFFKHLKDTADRAPAI